MVVYHPVLPAGAATTSFRWERVSTRDQPTRPYAAPSAVVMLEDFGGKGNGAFDNATAIADAITDAKALGNQRTGVPLGFYGGRYRTSQPIVLPRSGATPNTIVWLVGGQTRTAILHGLGSFPTGRAMIEWEQPADVSNLKGWAMHQRIENLHIILPSVAGTKGIWHKKVGVGTTLADYANEWLQCDLLNLQLEYSNQYHEVVIDLEIGNRCARMENLFGVGARHTNYDTLFLRAAWQRGVTDPAYIDEDGVGIGFCHLANIYPMHYGGAWTQAFQGRIYESSWDGAFGQGGHYGSGSNFHFINSGLLSLSNLRCEGKGEEAQFHFERCDQVTVTNSGPVTPTAPYSVWQANHAYVLGEQVVPTRMALTTLLPSRRSFVVTTAGTSGATEPTWVDTLAATTTDNSVTWTAEGPSIGDGVLIEASKDIHWQGRHARVGSPTFKNRLVSAVNIDADSERCIFTDWHICEVSAGDAASQVANAGAVGDLHVIQGDGITGAGARRPYAVGAGDLTGAGAPESVIVAGVGSRYRRVDGGASTSLYIKESGTGATGWVAK